MTTEPGIDRIRKAGAPAHLGIGFGEAQAAKGDDCIFGARIQYDSDATLGHLAGEVPRVVGLFERLALVPQPESIQED